MRRRSHVRQTRPPDDRYTSDDHQKKLISDVQPLATGCRNMRGRRDGDDAAICFFAWRNSVKPLFYKAPIDNFRVEKVASPTLSYANVVRCSSNVKCDKPHMDEVLVLQSDDYIVEKRKRACLVKVRDFITLPNIRLLCYGKGFVDFDVRYVGGLWVMLEFKGVPLCAWSKDAFRKILAKWGIFAHLEDDLGEDVYKNRVFILTNFQGIISEDVKIKVDDNVYTIQKYWEMVRNLGFVRKVLTQAPPPKTTYATDHFIAASPVVRPTEHLHSSAVCCPNTPAAPITPPIVVIAAVDEAEAASGFSKDAHSVGFCGGLW
ncbi:unnamed protein product [Lactuca saligna]|uniref:DUF4283 domain-containing protein n=1 Tax=Lactuca saligna TaxID=75948 RepID=A0AA35ZJC5_LACSI|nr:unnamed protein product [Lactuca saligna]